MSLLDLDARWRRFNDPAYVCACCGMTFSGVFDIGFEAPDAWPHGDRPDGTDVLELGADRLSSELCRLDDQRFIRAVIALPLRGSDETVFLAPWAAVAPADFYAYLDGLSDEGGPLEPFPGQIANALPYFVEALGSTCVLDPGQGLERPRLRVLHGPLSDAQTDGIAFDDLLDLYAASGRDIRPHLTNG